ncbi:High-affinity branched-chain amino acid transport system permease protein LivH [Euzebya pacifica]|uniref:High-affinity branched-chain amino acid transport system permease protein LivH n=1 Tax=Euzebya pacifica TaxID=1608957 RepID=A0A346XWW7_9ACTN|nr:branched-chain amino acid ABC transporter permease [Euzebya pacifica]AXV06714.1 High-affinity branched-chain amino acid transport system permease protein LivH [Euzebya pacifica]
MRLLQVLADGLSNGSIYAMVALGFVLVYRSTKVLNFAHGELLMVGAYFALVALVDLDLPYLLAVPAAMVGAGLVAWALQRWVLRRLLDEDVFSVVLVTLGLSLILRSAVAFVFGVRERALPAPVDTYVDVGPVNVWSVHLLAIGATVLVFAAVGAFYRRSRYGLAMRAMASDQAVARLMGISAFAVFGLSWLMAGGLAALTGVLAGHTVFVSNNLGFVAIRALPAAVIGGLDSVRGALLGGLLLGVAEQLASFYVGGETRELAAFAALLLVLVVRPYGLFGTPEIKRV